MQVEDAPLTGRSVNRIGAAAGFAGLAGATAILAVVNLVAPAVPFPPFQAAQALIRATPGGLATAAIERLGHLALPLATFGAALLFVASGTLVGILALRLSRSGGVRAWAVAMGTLWAVWFAIAPSRSMHPGAYLVAAAVGTATAAWVAASVAGRLRAAPPPPPDAPDDPTRRYLFRAGAAGVGGVLLGMSGLSSLIRPSSDPGGRPLSLASVSAAPPASPGAADASFAKIPGLTPEVTPLRDFYTIDEAIVDPSLDAESWRLRISGLVDRPVDLTYADLTDMRAVERPQTLSCVSNPVGGGLMSTAVWTGIPMREVLQRAGADPGRAVEVVFRSADGYSNSLSFEQAMDPETLLALGMNGRTLPRAHGYPARLLATGTYGTKNPKWVTSIEVVDAPYDGYWEQRGWAKVAPVKTGARIDTVRDGDEVSGTVTVAGVAFAGDRGISAVEVSTDAGASWNPALLKSALGPFTWRLWRYDWRPEEPGQALVVARARDGEGTVQTATVAGPHPDGASGLHEVTVTVTGA